VRSLRSCGRKAAPGAVSVSLDRVAVVDWVVLGMHRAGGFLCPDFPLMGRLGADESSFVNSVGVASCRKPKARRTFDHIKCMVQSRTEWKSGSSTDVSHRISPMRRGFPLAAQRINRSRGNRAIRPHNGQLSETQRARLDTLGERNVVRHHPAGLTPTTVHLLISARMTHQDPSLPCLWFVAQESVYAVCIPN
jgi:hypothetical protein